MSTSTASARSAGDRNLANLESFLQELDVFAEKNNFNVMIILSADLDSSAGRNSQVLLSII